MEIILFLGLSFLLIGYSILDGFDLGAGILFPLVAQNELDRCLMMNKIGPIWDRDEVWLVAAGGKWRICQITRVIIYFEDLRGSYEHKD